MREYITKLCGFIFMLGIVLYGLLFWVNTFTDFVIDDRYLNSEIILIVVLIAGVISTFMPIDKNDVIKNKNDK